MNDRTKAHINKAKCSRIPIDLSESEVRMDLETPLEWFFVILGTVGIFATITLARNFENMNPWYILGGIIITVFSFYMRSKTDCTYIINNMTKAICFRRTILGLTSETQICNFSGIHATCVQGEYFKENGDNYWNYWVIIILKSGKVIDVTDGFRDEEGFEICNTFAEKLATHFDTRFLVREACGGVLVEVNPHNGALEISQADVQTSLASRTYIGLAYILLPLVILMAGIGFFYLLLSN